MTDVVGPHDLVRPPILQHAVLMNPGLVRERVPADDGLVGLNTLSGEFGEQLAGGEELLRLDAGGHRHQVRSDLRDHDDFFERGVAGALADAVDRALDLPHARANRRQRVRDREPEVIVTMRAEHRAIGVRHPRDDRRKNAAISSGVE